MANTKQSVKNTNTGKKSNRNIFIALGLFAVLFIGFVAFRLASGGDQAGDSYAAGGENLVIQKSEISDTAKFYPYKVGKTNMEVVALKASDGSVRTALNTCQVCFDSGRGYYEQDGTELVCQNCGNRFNFDDVEKIKGGCNPVPIMPENKTEDDAKITISKEFLEQNKELFSNWNKQ